MKIGVLKESREGENRVALTPSVVQSLQKAGFEVMIEAGSGLNSSYSDEAYEKAGARIQASKADLLSGADLVIKVNTPSDSEIGGLKEGSSLISFIYGAMNPGMVQSLNNRKVSVFAMDAIPRISRAQNMDALSSQSNLAGYKAVIMGANAMGKIFPLMMTAAGTITPSRVVIFGAGVAGLQAIATAKRLGAIVEVTDVRPETKEQVESLGGKFIEVKSDDTVKVEGGYAKEVSAEYLQKQKEAVNKSLFQADLVITTALVMGKKAPVLITEEQVKQMKLGAVIVDMAIEQGGNCEASELGKTVVKHGVKIIGQANLPSTLANNASELYAKNVYNLLMHLATKDGFKWELEEEITKGTLIAHQGQILNQMVKQALSQSAN
ncbi:MAG: Re/Si-specific NAD(P)(+) transhydrogenase subunit alpha [Bacteroidia bacterium]|nr:Re/Si-specific NAD(P)(+) transhydrogenase subunit alpha [Bacteroidia bacterium]